MALERLGKLRPALRERLFEMQRDMVAVGGRWDKYAGAMAELGDLVEELLATPSPKPALDAATIEACAKVAETFPAEMLYVYPRGPNDPPGNQMVKISGQRFIADAIRSLSPSSKEKA